MKHKEQPPSEEEIQSNLDALNRTHETYNGGATNRTTQLAAERSFSIYQRWLVQHGVQFYLDTKSHTWKLRVVSQDNTKPEEGGSTLGPL